jgi:hypothetical protein
MSVTAKMAAEWVADLASKTSLKKLTTANVASLSKDVHQNAKISV